MFGPYEPHIFWGTYGPEPYWAEPPFETPQEEIEALKEEEADHKGELEVIQKRLAELQHKGPGA